MWRCAGVVLLAVAAASGAAFASKPVPRTVEVCVSHGTVKGDPYVYRPFVWADGKQREIDLSTFEGMTLRLRGNLYPGDRLGVNSIDVIDKRC